MPTTDANETVVGESENPGVATDRITAAEACNPEDRNVIVPFWFPGPNPEGFAVTVIEAAPAAKDPEAGEIVSQGDVDDAVHAAVVAPGADSAKVTG